VAPSSETGLPLGDGAAADPHHRASRSTAISEAPTTQAVPSARATTAAWLWTRRWR
jgi:hypothetical protein